MLNQTTPQKFTAKKTRILGVFTKALEDLETLVASITGSIVSNEEKVKEAQAENALLETELKSINHSISKIKDIVE